MGIVLLAESRVALEVNLLQGEPPRGGRELGETRLSFGEQTADLFWSPFALANLVERSRDEPNHVAQEGVADDRQRVESRLFIHL